MIVLPDPEIVTSRGQRLVGLAARYDMANRHEIAALYGRFTALRDEIEGAVADVLYGVSFDARPDGSFRYAVAVEVPEPGAMPEGCCVIDASAGSYAVFRQRTPIAEFPARFDAIFANWLPGAPVTQRAGAVLERYPEDDAPETGRMLYEIWVPVAV